MRPPRRRVRFGLNGPNRRSPRAIQAWRAEQGTRSSRRGTAGRGSSCWASATALVEALVALGNGHSGLPSELSYKLPLRNLVDAGEAKGQLVFDGLIRRLETAQS